MQPGLSWSIIQADGTLMIIIFSTTSKPTIGKKVPVISIDFIETK